MKLEWIAAARLARLVRTAPQSTVECTERALRAVPPIAHATPATLVIVAKMLLILAWVKLAVTMEPAPLGCALALVDLLEPCVKTPQMQLAWMAFKIKMRLVSIVAGLAQLAQLTPGHMEIGLYAP